MGEEQRATVGGIQADRQVVEDAANHRFLDPGRRLAIGQGLVVRDHDVHRDAEFLENEPVLQRAEEVTDVQLARGALAGQDAKPTGVALDLRPDLIASRLGGGECALAFQIVVCRHRRHEGRAFRARAGNRESA